jgi:CheY-like chemotaxis protein
VAHTILLADDSVTIQRVIELTFADEDVQVIAVSNGDQAIARLNSAPPDIVLADIGMPGKDGYEVARYVKQSPRLSHIPVVLLTGAFEPVDQARAAEVQCDGVLAKPFEPQLVIGRVKELLSSGASHVATADAEAVGSASSESAPDGQSELDDYFDRLDVAFAKLSGKGATHPTHPPDAPDTLEASSEANTGADTLSSDFEWDEEAERIAADQASLADQIDQYTAKRAPEPPAADLPLSAVSFLATQSQPPVAEKPSSPKPPVEPSSSSQSAFIPAASNRAPSSLTPSSRSAPSPSSSASSRSASASSQSAPSQLPSGQTTSGQTTSGQAASLTTPPLQRPSPPPVVEPPSRLAGVEASPPSPSPSGASQSPSVKRPQVNVPPSIAEAFAAILAAEQTSPTSEAAPAWPLFTAPSSAMGPSVPATVAPSMEITDDFVQRVADRVLGQMSDQAVKETVSKIVSDVAERLIREEIERIKASLR